MIKIKDQKLQATSRISILGQPLSLAIGGIKGVSDLMLDSIAYTNKTLVVLVSLDNTPHGILMHASISYADRDPTWDEIKSMKDAVFGDTDVMMVLPRSDHYINLQTHTFHLWQMPVEWGIR